MSPNSTGATMTRAPQPEARKPFYRGHSTEKFFSEVCDEIGRFDGRFILVAHMLSTLPPFLRGLERIGRVAGIVPKPSSIDPAVFDWAHQNYAVLDLTRPQTSDPDYLCERLRPIVGSARFILLDIGGYFAVSADRIRRSYPDQLLGLIEDTENGHQRYMANPDLPVPCVSVARSLSKRNEDRWVGQSIVYSAETLLREGGATLDLKRALVIGFGKIGQSIAHTLKRRGLFVTVWDTDPNQRVYARCENFEVIDKPGALREADLIFCATGNKSLRSADFRSVRKGSVIFSVTSSDDEFSFEGMDDYLREDVDSSVVRMSCNGHSFFLANEGNAVNFLHGAEVRPFVHLVQAAMLHGVDTLLKSEARCGWITPLSKERETSVAEIFERCFFDEPVAGNVKAMIGTHESIR